jgi:DUF1680 family protein
VNGRILEAVADPGSYLAIRRVWEDGDTVRVSLPMELRLEALDGDETVAAALYGPLVLAAPMGAGPASGPTRIVHGRPTMPHDLPKPDPLPKVPADASARASEWIKSESLSELRFKAAGESAQYDLMPMYQIRDQKYSVYWQMKSEKKQS